MTKRGISPLIATMLIVGLVFVLAVLLNIFLRGFAERETEDIEFKSKLNDLCIKDTRLELKGICLDFDFATNITNMRITFENKDTYPIENMSFKISAGENFEVTGVDKSIGKFERKTFEVLAPEFTSRDILEIDYFKNLKVEGRIGECEPINLELEPPGDNLMPNPDFSLGNDGWTISVGEGSNCAEFNGENVKLRDITPAGCAITRNIKLVPNKAYNVGSNVYLGSFPPEEVAISLFIIKEGGSIVAAKPFPKADLSKLNEWQYISKTIIPEQYNPGEVSNINITLQVGLNTGADVLFDNIEVREGKIPICD